MIFKSISISNFKGIKDLTLNFNSGINLIIGENGVGKTSILEAMTISLGTFFNKITGVSKNGIKLTDVHFETSILGDASISKKYYTPSSITAQFDVNNKSLEATAFRESESGSARTRFYGAELQKYASSLCNNESSVLPLLCSFGTRRVAQSKRVDFGRSRKNKLDDRRCGYIGCMDENLDRKSLESWCMKMETIMTKRKQDISEYSLFKTIVADFMKNINSLKKAPEVYYSFEYDQMVYEENDFTIPIEIMSAGYQSLLWMIMTMAFRLCQLNPFTTNYKETPGIVLIDEIDMHLHPVWQWKVIDALQTTFPMVQFILATHAPIIISSAKNAKLIRIDTDGQITYPKTTYGFSITDIVELTQGSNSIPTNLRVLKQQFENYFRTGQKELALGAYEKMKSDFGEDNSEVKLAKRRLELM